MTTYTDYWGVRKKTQYQQNLKVAIDLLVEFYGVYEQTMGNPSDMLSRFESAMGGRSRLSHYILTYDGLAADLHRYDYKPFHMFLHDAKWGAYDRLFNEENNPENDFALQVEEHPPYYSRPKHENSFSFPELGAWDFFFRWMNEKPTCLIEFEFPFWFDLHESPVECQKNETTWWGAFESLMLQACVSANDMGWCAYVDKVLEFFPECPYAEELYEFFEGWVNDGPYTCQSYRDAVEALKMFYEHKGLTFVDPEKEEEDQNDSNQ